MSDNFRISGVAAPLPLANLDTDQIMPKQFLRGIDKSGLDAGVFYDMRFDEKGRKHDDFVLNRPAYAQTRILVAGSNFGCGSSREHAVWGLQQFGIQAVIASSFAEIFHANAMNNRLLLVALTEPEVQAIMADADRPSTSEMSIDIQAMTVRSHSCEARFTMAPRHRHMFLEGLDMIGATLEHRPAIDAFASRHGDLYPWLKNVAGRTRERLHRG
ncbi:3-isopropylmalate dehydratase small subunit [Pollutimonas sp. M17]|uniref:3-isopropylmalate dehydratase small subunit n=1 Tax=Pollutimonas sp. M17 TaxID=2962065 RepID=UPI0021F3F8E5|nr:3-isopropylmalate dehydratase small subunit [Pollutimonas sp. M17]UYO92507.1 3-isopropylmalate dehydratase small subunit [Pollutimonas sp. M17]HWK69799.1 3-isopropylmalate dehydratase small subunit [Burkholderiaceae bacterium]